MTLNKQEPPHTHTRQCAACVKGSRAVPSGCRSVAFMPIDVREQRLGVEATCGFLIVGPCLHGPKDDFVSLRRLAFLIQGVAFSFSRLSLIHISEPTRPY